MSKYPFIVLSVFFLFTPFSHASIYKTVHSDGSVTYSDKRAARGQSEAIQVKTPNTAPAVKIAAPTPAFEIEELVPDDYQVSITAPAEGTQVPMGQSNVPVHVQLQPALHSGHKLQLLVNGEAFGAPSLIQTLELTNIYRGAHRVEVAVIAVDGKIIFTSEPVTIYVQRAIAR